MKQLLLVGVGFLSGSLSAQTSWIVPTGVDLAPYIAQASPGDTLLLGASHPGFTLGKELVLRPQSGRTVIAWNYFPGATGSSFIQPPAGQSALLVNLDFASAPPLFQGHNGIGHPVEATGQVSFEGCTFQCVGSSSTALTSRGSTTLRNCTLGASFSAMTLRVESGSCSAVNCLFQGANAVSGMGMNDQHPHPGAIVLGGTFHASRCTFTPGAAVLAWGGLAYPVGPAPGLFVNGGTAFLVDCTASGGSFPTGFPGIPGPYLGSPAILVNAGSVHYTLCNLQPGNGGPGYPPAARTIGNATPDNDLVGIQSSGRVRIGTTWTATAIAGASSQTLGFAFGFGLAPSTVPFVPEPVWLDPAQAILAGFSNPAPGASVPAALAVPNVLSLVGAELWCQAVQLDGPLVRVSPVVGGVIY